jgi:hypothetical protein
LIAYSIETGRQLLVTGTLSRCIVSTDKNEIADCAKALGADVPFMRLLQLPRILQRLWHMFYTR